MKTILSLLALAALSTSAFAGEACANCCGDSVSCAECCGLDCGDCCKADK